MRIDIFPLTILSKAERPQVQWLSPEGKFWERSSAEQALLAVKRTVEWSKKVF